MIDDCPECGRTVNYFVNARCPSGGTPLEGVPV